MVAGFSLRISTSILNPSYTIDSGGIEVRTLLQNQNIVIENGIAAGLLSTRGISISSHKIFLGWGVDVNPAKNLPIPMNVVRGDAATPGYYPYNAFTVISY